MDHFWGIYHIWGKGWQVMKSSCKSIPLLEYQKYLTRISLMRARNYVIMLFRPVLHDWTRMISRSMRSRLDQNNQSLCMKCVMTMGFLFLHGCKYRWAFGKTEHYPLSLRTSLQTMSIHAIYIWTACSSKLFCRNAAKLLYTGTCTWEILVHEIPRKDLCKDQGQQHAWKCPHMEQNKLWNMHWMTFDLIFSLLLKVWHRFNKLRVWVGNYRLGQ